MTVYGQSLKDALQDSSLDLTVIETKEIKKQAVDTGEVIARTQGVAVRRSGGLGSGERFSMNGVSDERIRFFIDGIPLELAGYSFGLSNVPLQLVERIELYRGVVPVAFGTDALGGAINLVSDQRLNKDLYALSATAGSFGTYRMSWVAKHIDKERNLIFRASGFNDYARNNYPIEVKVPDADGRSEEITVRRFHDSYRAAGARLEAGLIQRDWADSFLLKLFYTESAKDIQNSPTMAIPYGAATQGSASQGASLHHELALSENLGIQTILGFTETERHLSDESLCLYNWQGQCQSQRVQPGEFSSRAVDKIEAYRSAYARFHGNWQVAEGHKLRLSLAYNDQERSGKDKDLPLSSAYDPLRLKKELNTFASGLEYETIFADERIDNTVFVKRFEQEISTESSPFMTAAFVGSRKTDKLGFGDSGIFRIGGGLSLKASFEKTTRMPSADEIFGDGALVLSNLDLKPETSENYNLGFAYQNAFAGIGKVETGLSGFVRDIKDLILIVQKSVDASSYVNVYNARSTGYEWSGSLSSLDRRYALNANATQMEFVNSSGSGLYAQYKGDRIPNQPSLFANASLAGTWKNPYSETQDLGLAWNSRYTSSFYREWKRFNSPDSKIPEQISHSLSLNASSAFEALRYSVTLEVQNIMDGRLFDNFGVQKPGRAYFLKMNLEY